MPLPEDESCRFAITETWTVRVWGSNLGAYNENYFFDFLDTTTGEPISISTLPGFKIIQIPQVGDYELDVFDIPPFGDNVGPPAKLYGHWFGERYLSDAMSVFALQLPGKSEIIFRMPRARRRAQGRDAGAAPVEGDLVF